MPRAKAQCGKESFRSDGSFLKNSGQGRFGLLFQGWGLLRSRGCREICEGVSLGLAGLRFVMWFEELGFEFKA